MTPLIILTLAVLAWVVYERYQRRTTERRLVQLRRRSGTPSQRESELVAEVAELERRLIRRDAQLRMVEAERDDAREREQVIRASLHNRVQARREADAS